MHQTIFCTLIFYASSIFGHTPYLESNIYTLEKINAIPKIIHQIWVGKKPISKQYQQFMKTWQDIHPDWEYKLWTDNDIDDFPWTNKDIFLEAVNPGMKSDIWRYEIIKLHGGLYVDCDMECKRSFNPIHERLHFYSGYHHDNVISNGIIASTPNGDVIEAIVAQLRTSKTQFDIQTHDPNTIIAATGPLFLCRVWEGLADAKTQPTNVLFPEEYFQPVQGRHHGTPKTNVERDNIKNKCFSVHHNGVSWFRRSRKPIT